MSPGIVDLALLRAAGKHGAAAHERRIDFVGSSAAGSAAPATIAKIAQTPSQSQSQSRPPPQQQQQQHQQQQQNAKRAALGDAAESKKKRTTGRDDNGGRLQLAWTSQRSVGPGLVNCGNTCFLNSVLQCLTYIPPLAEALLAGEHSRSCANSAFCVMCAMETHIKRCLVRTQSAFPPAPFVQNIKRIARHMRIGRQEDAHEFTRFLLEGLQKGEESALKASSTLTSRIFNGSLQSQILCLQCKNPSNTIDPIMDLSLDIKDCKSLDMALRRFTASELLTKPNQYNCSKCHALRDARKRIAVLKAPPVLTIQFKRFDFLHSLGSKISRPIVFDARLNLAKYMANPGKQNTLYDLSAVLVHSGGSCYSGHYYSYVKAPNGKWYCSLALLVCLDLILITVWTNAEVVYFDIWSRFCMNDSHVKQVSEKTVLEQSAYMLFYTSHSLNQPPVREPAKSVVVQAGHTPVSSTPTRLAESSVPASSNSSASVTSPPSNSRPHPQPHPQQQPLSIQKPSSRLASSTSSTDKSKKPQTTALEAIDSSSKEERDDAQHRPSQPELDAKNAKHPPRQVNSTVSSWSVSHVTNGSDAPRQSHSVSSTSPWITTKNVQSEQSTSVNTHVWEDIDSALLEARKQLEQETGAPKRRRPTQSDMEYDAPKKSKKKRRDDADQMPEAMNHMQHHRNNARHHSEHHGHHNQTGSANISFRGFGRGGLSSVGRRDFRGKSDRGGRGGFGGSDHSRGDFRTNGSQTHGHSNNFRGNFRGNKNHFSKRY
eukprot:jgi/Hompol1/640/HPOL_002561-RA